MTTGTIHCAECCEPAYSAYGHKRTCSLYGVRGYASHYYKPAPASEIVIYVNESPDDWDKRLEIDERLRDEIANSGDC